MCKTGLMEKSLKIKKTLVDPVLYMSLGFGGDVFISMSKSASSPNNASKLIKSADFWFKRRLLAKYMV
jgi:hypothetical protein